MATLPPARSVSSLDPLETNHTRPRSSRCLPADHPDHLDLDERDRAPWEHQGWWPIRRKVLAAFKELEVSASRLDAFHNCSRYSWLQHSTETPGQYRVIKNRCHDRFCVTCSHNAARRVQRVVAKWMEGREMRFVTLTLRHDKEQLSLLVERLGDSFRRLRKTEAWQRRVAGGIAFLEIKWHDKHGWHPHLHVLIEGSFFPQHLLAKEWLRITKDSRIVDIRRVKDSEKVTQYVSKYATKGFDQSVFTTKQTLQTAITFLKGRRLVTTFGSWRGFQVTNADNPESWETLMTLEDFQARINEKDPWAVALLDHLRDPNRYSSPGPPPPDKPPIDHLIIEPVWHQGELFDPIFTPSATCPRWKRHW
jgi:hypothetical protein